MKRCFFIVGEDSGDVHAAAVIREMKQRDPDLEIHAYGGQRMKEAGAIIHFPLPSMALTGLLDAVKKYFQYRHLAREALHLIQKLDIKTLILVDFPGFNLRIATQAKRLGIKVIYYISPQVWAWHTSRVKRMKRDLDLVLVILPFEEPFLKKHGVPALFVGHPLVDQLAEQRPVTEILREHKLPPDVPLVGLMPGSRRKEVDRLLPVLCETAVMIQEQEPSVLFLIPKADSVPLDYLQDRIQQEFTRLGKTVPYRIIDNPGRDFRRVLRFCLTKSGTSTLENAILGVPQLVIYRVGWLDAILARRLIKIKWVGLVNILAGKTICPEFLQENCLPSKIVPAAIELIHESEARDIMLKEMDQVVASLGSGGAAQKAAWEILERLHP